MVKKPLKVLFADNHLIAVEKPCGVLTQPNSIEAGSLQEEVEHWAKETYQKPGAVFLQVIHRLDRVVSGVVLFAKTSKALSRLNEMQRNHQIKKTYVACVEGIIEEDHGHLIHYLTHEEHRAEVFARPKEKALKSELIFQVLRRRDEVTEVQIELITGRYHQIRAQFAFIGHPIVGDEKYGAKRKRENSIFLHHEKMELIHPVTQEALKIVSKIDFFI